MTDTTIDIYLLSLDGVTRCDIKHLGLRRYLLHDVPFAVFDSRGNLHIRVHRAKVKELSVRYSKIIIPSELYDSKYWVAVLSGCLCDLDDAVIYDAFDCAVERILLTLPPLSRVLYTEKNPIPYQADYKRALEHMTISPLTANYVKKINKPD